MDLWDLRSWLGNGTSTRVWRKQVWILGDIEKEEGGVTEEEGKGEEAEEEERGEGKKRRRLGNEERERGRRAFCLDDTLV